MIGIRVVTMNFSNLKIIYFSTTCKRNLKNIQKGYYENECFNPMLHAIMLLDKKLLRQRVINSLIFQVQPILTRQLRNPYGTVEDEILL